MYEVSLTCLNALLPVLTEVGDMDGKVGKLGRSRLVSVTNMAKHLGA